MSVDIHFAAEVSVSETARVGRLRAARNALIRATRSCSALSRLAPSTTNGAIEPSKPTTASTVATRATENRIITPLAAAILDAATSRGVASGSQEGLGRGLDPHRLACLPSTAWPRY